MSRENVPKILKWNRILGFFGGTFGCCRGKGGKVVNHNSKITPETVKAKGYRSWSNQGTGIPKDRPMPVILRLMGD